MTDSARFRLALQRRTVRIASAGLGCVFPLVLLVSGVALWPLFDLVGKDALPGLFALGLGFWFGATRRLPSGRALAIANAAVLVGLVLFIASWPLVNGDIVSFLWIAAALAILFGWAMALPSFVRVLVSLRGRA